MKKIYWVEVRSHTSAKMRVEASSKGEACEIAAKQMEKSLARLLKEAPKRDDIKNLDGYSEALKSGIEIEKS